MHDRHLDEDDATIAHHEGMDIEDSNSDHADTIRYQRQRELDYAREIIDGTYSGEGLDKWRARVQVLSEAYVALAAHCDALENAVDELRFLPGEDCWCAARSVDDPDSHSESCLNVRAALAATTNSADTAI